jgi:hypothetical protein
MSRSLLIAASLGFLLVACGSPTAPGGSTPIQRTDGTRHFAPVLAEGDFITHAEFTSDGTLWVGTFRGVLIREIDGRATPFALGPPENGLLQDLFVDSHDRVWVSTKVGFGEFRDGVWDESRTAGGASLVPPVSEIAVNPAGDLLLAAGNASGGGLWLRRDGEWASYTPSTSPLPTPITHDIVVGPDGAFWIASGAVAGAGGVSRIGAGSLEAVLAGPESGLLYSAPESLAITASRLVMGFEVFHYDDAGPDGGMQVLRFSDGSLETYFPDRTDYLSSRVRSVTVSPDGDTWFTTSLDEAIPTCVACFSGVGRLDPSGNITVLDREAYGIAPNEFLPHIFQDPDGRVHFVTPDRIVRVRP